MQQTAEVFKGLKPHIIHGTKKYDKNHHTLISTIQTAYRRDINPDVIIIDEIHHGYSGKMVKELIKDKKDIQIIGLSATPYDESGNLLDGFDLVLNQYDMKYMIKNGYLVPIRAHVLTKPDLSNVDIIAGDYNIAQLGKVVSKNNTILEIVTSSKSFILESNKTIVFAVDINHAELLSKSYRQEGFTSVALHSKLQREDIEYEIERFKKGHTKVLVSVLMLTTGFDVPETDLAIIARPTKSQNLYKQMVGRIARIAKDKKYGILLDCGNVIENLGKPLDPIKPTNTHKSNRKITCDKCESENIRFQTNQYGMFWECQDCSYIKEIENKNLYQCEHCNKEYSYEGSFEIVNNKLYLNCTCGYETLISEFTGTEKFLEIEDNTIYEGDGKYISFIESREYARSLGYKNKTLWDYHIKNKEKYEVPNNVPLNPDEYYKNNGWVSWEDWLVYNQKVVNPNIKKLCDEYKNELSKYLDTDLLKSKAVRKNIRDFKEGLASGLIQLTVNIGQKVEDDNANLILYNKTINTYEKILSKNFGSSILKKTTVMKNISKLKKDIKNYLIDCQILDIERKVYEDNKEIYEEQENKVITLETVSAFQLMKELKLSISHLIKVGKFFDYPITSGYDKITVDIVEKIRNTDLSRIIDNN